MRNIKFWLIVLFTLGLYLTVEAQNKKTTNSLLWEISGNGLQKPSYLFGTYHFAGKDFIDTMKVLNEKLKLADAVVGELIIDDQLAQKLIPYMMLKDNSLDKIFTPEEYRLVDDYIKQFKGYELKFFNGMKPVVVQTMLLQLTAPKTFTAANPALDLYIQNDGKANGKPLIGLETVEEQAEILFGQDIARQKELLLKNVKEAEKNKKEGQKLYDYYVAQNLEQLEKLLMETDGYTPAEMDQLLKNRNLNWLQQLPALMKAQSLFIAVGAGHLLGSDGLIKGLTAKGYTLKPIATN